MNVSTRRLAVLLAGASALHAIPATAQDRAGDDEILVTAQGQNATQVVSAGSVGVLGDKRGEDVPFSIRSYNEALILNQQPQTLGQVLENDPTIRTTYGFGNAAEQFVIRGFTLYGDDVGLNGLYGITPRQLIAPELYQEVQVLNGATAFLNGAAPGGTGIGGSVNLIAKRAGDAPLTRITGNYTSDSHFGGSFDVSRRFGDDGAWGVRINGAGRSGDVAIEDEFRSSYVIGGAIDYRGAAVRLSADLGYQRVRIRGLRPKVTIGAGAAIPAVPDADANYAQPWTYSTLRDVFGTARVEWDVADNAMLYAQAGARDGSERGLYSGLTINNAATGAATGTALFVPLTANNEAAQGGLRVKLAGAGISHEINVGGSHIWQVNRNAYDFLYGPGFAGFATNLYDTPVATIPSSTLVGGNLDDPFPVSRTRLGSVFASDTLGFFEDRLLVTAGLRLQTIAVKSYAITNGALATRYDEDAITPVVGIVFKPTPTLSVYANRIEGLQQGPTASTTDTTLINPGEIFAPFKSVQYEVGAKFAIGAINASLAAFTTDLPSAYAIPDPQGTGFNRFGVFGKQRNRGLEFTLGGELTRGLRLISGVSVLDTELRDQALVANEGNTAPGVPEWLANANVEWDLSFVPGLTLTGRVVHTGEQQVNAANTLSIGDWTRFDLGARYVAVIGEMPLTFRFAVDNVANRRYWASAFDTSSQALLQGAPRTFKLSASIDL